MAQKKKVPAKSQVSKSSASKPAAKKVAESPRAAAAATKTKTKSVAKSTERQSIIKPIASQHRPAKPAGHEAEIAADAKVAASMKGKIAAAEAKVKASNAAPKSPVREKPATASRMPAAAVGAKQAVGSALNGAARSVPSAAPKQMVRSASPQTPRDIAAKAVEARQQPADLTAKKPVSQRHGFKTNEYIVYPAHGVGRIVGIEEQEIAGMSLELFVIQFEKDKMTLRVPTGKLQSVGMRKLADDDIVTKAMTTLKGRARIKRTMWSRRAQEYEAKINSGDLVAIAEVVRDLFRSESQPEQSYSERQLYEAALDRMAREISAVEQLDERGAVQRITEVLAKSARGRRLALEAAEDGAAGDAADIKAA